LIDTNIAVFDYSKQSWIHKCFRWKYVEPIQWKTETTCVDSGHCVVELDCTEPHSKIFRHTWRGQ